MAPPAPAETRLRHVPNALTLLRLGLAVAFFLMLTFWNYADSPMAPAQRRAGAPPMDHWLLGAAAIFAAAAFTDFLDGYLARRWQVITPFGRVMDPVADKLLVIGAFVYLAGPGFRIGPEAFEHSILGVRPSASGVYSWMVAVVLSRELLVTSIRAVLEAQQVPFPAVAGGKWKMAFQSISIPVVLVLVATIPVVPTHPAKISDTWLVAVHVLMWAVVLVTVWSGVPYVTAAAKAFRSAGTPENRP